jgi:hypothetical protein
MPLPPELIARRGDRRSRLGDIIVLLASNQEGEVINAVRALGRALESAGVDYHDLVKHIEEPSLSDRQITLIREEIDQRARIARDQGIAEGLRRAEAKQSGFDDFYNTDGTPDWRQVARFVQREKRRLLERHHEFVDDMASRVPFNREPTPKQLQYLQSLFFKLGGKLG